MSLLEQKLSGVESEAAGAASSTGVSGSSQGQLHDGHEQQTTLQKISSFSIETGPSKKEILNFTNQLAVMIRAGINLPEALDLISSQTKKVKFKVKLVDLKNQIEGGMSFSQALSRHPDIFSSLYINMIAAAEISGAMSSMLEQLASYLDQEAQTRSQVIGAMVYPMIIAGMAVTTVIFLLVFVLPRFLTVFAGNEHLLPAPTKIIMAASGGLRHYWFIIFPAIGIACWAMWYFTRTGIGKLWWDKTKLRIPLLNTLCRSLYITRSLHTMGVLTNAGVPILDTIAITAQISGNMLYKNMWLGVHEAVREGKKIAISLASYELLPASVVQMVRSGEETGSLSSVLKDVAEFYARELQTVIKVVTSMIEPIMIILMGLLVGFIAMSIILPIFKMSSLVTS